MQEKCIIIKESYYYKVGQIIEGKKTKNGILTKKHFLPKESYVSLKETLNKQDEAKVRDIVRDIMKRVFWRWYTRSSFFLK
jgi:hypothetical protein